MAAFTAMIDMAKTPDDVKKEVADMGGMAVAPAKPSVMTYPYGLCLSLEDEQLAKLGLDKDEMPSVGDMIHLCAMAKVTNVSSSEREMTDGSKNECRRIELQITHLATENEEDENTAAQAEMDRSEARRKRFYNGDGMPDAAE